MSSARRERREGIWKGMAFYEDGNAERDLNKDYELYTIGSCFSMSTNFVGKEDIGQIRYLLLEVKGNIRIV